MIVVQSMPKEIFDNTFKRTPNISSECGLILKILETQKMKPKLSQSIHHSDYESSNGFS